MLRIRNGVPSKLCLFCLESANHFLFESSSFDKFEKCSDNFKSDYSPYDTDTNKFHWPTWILFDHYLTYGKHTIILDQLKKCYRLAESRYGYTPHTYILWDYI